jgi:hypothetical protein
MAAQRKIAAVYSRKAKSPALPPGFVFIGK